MWKEVTDDLLREALVVENSTRCSEEGQARFQAAEEREDHDWMEEATLMQKEALEAVGIEPTAQHLAQLRAAALKNPELALYVMNNLCRDGEICRFGENAPECVVRNLENQKLPWPPKDMVDGVPLVVIAGSVS